MTTGNGRKTNVDDIVAKDLRFERGRLIVCLADDREVSVPLEWYPSLQRASATDRKHWRFIGRGVGIHWPRLDVDLSVAGLVNGFREAIPKPPRLTAPAARRKSA